MATQVERIITLFDELDPYEFKELVEDLSIRGYKLSLLNDKNINELWINQDELEAQKITGVKSHLVGIYLHSYKDQNKIATIKSIRNFPDEFKYLTKKELSLKEAKDYVESDQIYRRDNPFVWGHQEEIIGFFNYLKYDYTDPYGTEFRFVEID
jgi:ribosomal protein L7/L12